MKTKKICASKMAVWMMVDEKETVLLLPIHENQKVLCTFHSEEDCKKFIASLEENRGVPKGVTAGFIGNVGSVEVDNVINLAKPEIDRVVSIWYEGDKQKQNVYWKE